jgi:hypothetical protein
VIVRVLEGGAEQPALVFELWSLLLEPGKEGEHVRADVGGAQVL